MDFWFQGAFGAAKIKTKNKEVFQNVALIVGVTGISGNSLADILPLSVTPGGRWKVYGVARRPQPEWQFHQRINYIHCEMVDPQDTQAKLSNLTDITHIFYVGWVTESNESESSIKNTKMLRNVLNAVIPNAQNLQHICLQTGRKYHSLSRYPTQQCGQTRSFSEDLPRLDIQNCYYAMEDVLFEEMIKNKNLTWSIHRPAIMLGFSPYSTRNIAGSLCVYAAICKHEKMPLKFPGSRAIWEGYSETADADLVAEQQIWAAVEKHQGKGHAFNCSNGDVFKWRDLWIVLAEEFEVEFVELESDSVTLDEMMRDKDRVWEDMIEEYELLTTKLEEVGTWWYVDLVLRGELVLEGANQSLSMEKSKEYGFSGSRKTVESFRYWIHRTKTYKIVP